MLRAWELGPGALLDARELVFITPMMPKALWVAGLFWRVAKLLAPE